MYYIPTLDEFTIGFEYEEKDETGNFEKKTFNNQPFEFNTLLNIRVKELTKDDIINDLNFSFSGIESDKLVFTKNKNQLDNNDNWFTLYLDENNITLKNKHGITLIKDLYIKNKYELKWILNRYGLI